MTLNICPTLTFNNMNPDNDIYYCDKCDKIHICANDDKLNMAIKFLVVDRVKYLIGQMNENEIYDCNILNKTLKHLNTRINSKYNCVDQLIWHHFQGNVTSINRKELVEPYLGIVEIICFASPKSITEEKIKLSIKMNGLMVKDILIKYSVNNNPQQCSICHLSDTDNLIQNTCDCNNLVHMECLVSVTTVDGSFCRTCKSYNYGIVDPNGYRIIFPFKDIYVMPLMSKICLIADTMNSKLHFAITYLQVDRVKDLLAQITGKEYWEYYNGADYYAVHNKNSETGALILKSVPYSNISRKDNEELFNEMENLLAEYHELFVLGNIAI